MKASEAKEVIVLILTVLVLYKLKLLFLVMCKVGVMPVGRLPHMYHNGLPNQMQVMPNAVNVYPGNSSSVPRADSVAVSGQTWSDALSKLPASSAPSVTDHRPVKHIDLMSPYL